jgi:hypothetical protein
MDKNSRRELNSVISNRFKPVDAKPPFLFPNRCSLFFGLLMVKIFGTAAAAFHLIRIDTAIAGHYASYCFGKTSAGTVVYLLWSYYHLGTAIVLTRFNFLFLFATLIKLSAAFQ